MSHGNPSGVFSATAAGTNAGASATYTADAGQTFVVTEISGHTDKDSVLTIEGPAGTIFWEGNFDLTVEGLSFSASPTIPLPLNTDAVAKIASSTTDCQVNISGYII